MRMLPTAEAQVTLIKHNDLMTYGESESTAPRILKISFMWKWASFNGG